MSDVQVMLVSSAQRNTHFCKHAITAKSTTVGTMGSQQEQLIIPVRLRGAGGQEGEMSFERWEQEVAVFANQPALPVPAACWVSCFCQDGC